VYLGRLSPAWGSGNLQLKRTIIVQYRIYNSFREVKEDVGKGNNIRQKKEGRLFVNN
jgi:hypothetical protein